MQNKPTDMQTMVDTMTLKEVDAIVKESMGQLISSTGAMLKLQRVDKNIGGDPTPFEVLGWLTANLSAPVFSCYAKPTTPPQDCSDKV